MAVNASVNSPLGSSIEAGELADGAVTNAKVATAAAIAFSKLAALPSANILVGNGSNVATAVTASGNVTIDNAGVTTIGASQVTEAMQTLADNTTGDVSTSKHGYAPKAPNDSAKFLDGTGAWSTAAVQKNIMVADFAYCANGGGPWNSTATGSGAVTQTGGGASCSTGTTAASLASTKWTNTGSNPLRVNPFALKPVWSGSFEVVTITSTDFDAWIGVGMDDDAVPTTENHIGFLMRRASGTTTLYASNASGTTQTLTDCNITETSGVSYVLSWTFDGTTIKYYVDGVNVASVTTNVPTAAPSWWFVLGIKNAAGVTTLRSTRSGIQSLIFDLA